MTQGFGTRTFSGAGMNALTISDAVGNATRTPSRKTIPAGTTWPFSTLILFADYTELRMGITRKHVRPDTSVVSLNKYGYVLFRSDDGQNDFGFSVMRIKVLLDELVSRGFKLDETCTVNLRMAQMVLLALWIFCSALVISVTLLAFLKPHGL